MFFASRSPEEKNTNLAEFRKDAKGKNTPKRKKGEKKNF